jgi:acyl-CoA synthetase (AMP-forming)/AMP-acid ligase II
MRPDKCLRARSLVRRWGLTPAAAYGLAAIRHPDRAAIIDDRGPLTFAEVDRRANALAYALRRANIDHRDTVAIMCRNHRWFIEATVACCKLGANILYLDPSDSASRRADLVRSEDAHALIYDEEFSELLQPVGRGRQHFIAWCDADRPALCPLIEELIAREGLAAVPPPRKGSASTVLLARNFASGANGTERRLPNSLVIRGAAMSKIPLRRGEVTVVAAPMFGSWGFLQFMLGLGLASTLVLPRTFDPTAVLDAADRHQATALATLPETLTGIIELPEATSACYDTTALRVIAVQGPALASDVAIPAMLRFGDVLYNLHGSTVVQLNADWVRQCPEKDEPARATPSVRLNGGLGGEYAARSRGRR